MSTDPNPPIGPPAEDAAAHEPASQNAQIGDDVHSVNTPERTRLVVGIGASAGGIDAFKVFFSRMPADIGMAFVIVQHLDPNYESSLVAIIAGYTAMPVHLAEDGMLVGPDQVYVIPPDAILTIKGGILHIAAQRSRLPAAPRSTLSWPRLPRTRARTPWASSCPGSAATARLGLRRSRSMAA